MWKIMATTVAIATQYLILSFLFQWPTIPSNSPLQTNSYPDRNCPMRASLRDVALVKVFLFRSGDCDKIFCYCEKNVIESRFRRSHLVAVEWCIVVDWTHAVKILLFN
jgi:hypothetical protein